MIILDAVSKKFGRKQVLEDISFSLEKGKIYGMIGPNGSGKSTTLKIIAGLVFPTKGTVMVNGKKADRRIAREVAYLSELDFYYPTFTVKDMLQFTASQFADFDKVKAQELLSFMKLDPKARLKQLSKGNRGRLKLVLTLARDASILLLDEPFSGLDPMVRESIVKGLLGYIDFEKQTVVIATHEIDEIEMLLDDVIAIKDGEIYAIENVENLREVQGLSVLEWMKTIFGE